MAFIPPGTDTPYRAPQGRKPEDDRQAMDRTNRRIDTVRGRLDTIEQILGIGDYDPTSNPQMLMRWKGEWDEATTYYPGDVVIDSGFTMVANKQTTDRPAPQPFGTAGWMLPDDTTGFWTPQVNTSVVSTGVRVNVTNGLWQAQQLRVYIPNVDATANYRAEIINNVTGENEVGELRTGPGLTLNDWNTFVLPANTWVTKDDDVTFFLHATNTSGTTAVNGTWNFTSNNNDVIPGTGDAHERNNREWIRFNKTDALGATPAIDTAIINTTITSGSRTWTILDVADFGTYMEYDVLRDGPQLTNGQHPFLFTIPTPTPTDYVENDNYWGVFVNANVSGIRQFDQGTPLENNTAYGVDIFWQQFNASEDWEVVAYSG